MPTSHILAADIGGTSSRFAVFADQAGKLNLEHKVCFPTRGVNSFNALLALVKQSELGKLLPRCRAAAVAVAGAVHERAYVDPPNIAWDIDLRREHPTGLPRRMILLNDFEAQAYACGTEAVAQAMTINTGVTGQGNVFAVVGAGTGLGQSLLIKNEERILALPSEAGHMAFPFVGDAEQAFEAFVRERVGLEYVHTEVVVSGMGLSLLHAFHCKEEVEPALAAAALAPESLVLQWFARFYGRACRQFSLAVLPLGGLFVSGGVAAKNPCLVKDPAFMAEFVNNRAYGHLLGSIPVTLNTNQDSGLWGAALYARLCLQRGVALKG